MITYSLIEYPVGVMVEAVVLSMDVNRLRVAAAGFPDTLELTQSGLEWVTEAGEKVGIGFLQYADSEAAAVSPPGLSLRAGAAGSCATEG